MRVRTCVHAGGAHPPECTHPLARPRDMPPLHLAALQSKEELKTVALGTSKINYLDPRITVAW